MEEHPCRRAWPSAGELDVTAAQPAGPKTVLDVATIANLAIAASKFTAAVLTGSSAMATRMYFEPRSGAAAEHA